MNDEIRQTFVDETTETLTKLTNELLELEDQPGDQEVIAAIFRRAHTLKGNLGAMGFEDAAGLAHAMEDLLDEIRDGHLEVNADVIDELFEAVDGLEAIIQAVDSGEDHGVDFEEIETRLRTRIESDASSTETSTSSSDVAGDLVVTLEDGDLPGVDAMMVLESLDAGLDEFTTDPDRAALEDGEYDGSFGLSTSDPEKAMDVLQNQQVIKSIEKNAKTTSGTDDDSPSSSDPQLNTDVRSIRVNAERLDALHGLVESLVTARISIDRGVQDENLDAASQGLKDLGKALNTLQDEVMDMRLVPLETVFSGLPRLVRDLTKDMDKSVDLSIDGEDVELDRTIVNRLDDPLVHLLRNAIDHGIESPEEREAAGKPATGQVEIKAHRDRDTVIIEVSDDGGGMDPEGIRERAKERDVRSPDELEQMDDEALFELVFEPGFSTAEEVTDVSGRGVGMDAVSQTVSELDGTIDVSSEPGDGTTITLRLPVDIAIDDVLFVTVADRTVGIPVRTIAEIETVDSVKRIRGDPVVDRNDDLIPVVDLGDELGAVTADGGTAQFDNTMLVRIRPEERCVALACDNVLEQEEVVVRPLEGILADTPGLSGTTVLGEGNVVPIIDVHTL